MKFIVGCEIYTALVDEADTDRKIIFALSLIKGGQGGSAGKWADAIRMEMIRYVKAYKDRENLIAVTTGAKPPVAPTPAQQTIINNVPIDPFPTWQDFVERFKDHFMLSDKHDQARDALDLLVMNNSCEEYTTMFNGYELLAEYDEHSLLRLYKRGLKPQLRQNVTRVHPVPTTLAAWKKVALDIDREFRREKAYSAHLKGNTLGSSSWAPKPKPAPQADPNTMDVDTISTQTAKVNAVNTKPKCGFCEKLGKNPNHPEDKCFRQNPCPTCGTNFCDHRRGARSMGVQGTPRTIKLVNTSRGGTSADDILEQIKGLDEDSYQNLAAKLFAGF